MKGHVYKRGKNWSYLFNIDPDPLTGKRRQANGSGYKTEREAWKACRDAMADYEKGRGVTSSRHKVGDALQEWLTRIEHSIKPSMAQNWRNYADYYVIPYIGQREVQDITGAVCDALYAKLLAEGRVKARPKKRPTTKAVHVRRLAPDGRALPCRPHGYDTVRCYNTHAEDDPALGRPIEPRKLSRRAAEDAAEAARRKLNPGLEPKTVVNTHRMLHRAWEDFATLGWAKRNVVSDAHPPRVPRKGRKVWTVAQLQTFLQHARSDRFFALWVLEATSGMRRCELAGVRRDLLDLAAATLEIDVTRVVVDGKVIESDGKTENAQHVLALDPFTLAVLKAHVEMLDRERKDLGPDYHDHGVLFCWPDGRPPHPDTITRRFKQLAAAAGLPEIDLHDVRHSYATAGQRRGVASDATFREKREDTRPGLQLPRCSQRAAMVRQQCRGDLRCHHPVASAERMLQPLLLHPVTRMMRQMQRKAQRRGGMPLPSARQAQVFSRVGKPLPTSCDAKIDWKALSKRIGHADVAFTMKQYVQTDLEADRQVANTLAELIIGGSLASFEITGDARETG